MRVRIFVLPKEFFDCFCVRSFSQSDEMKAGRGDRSHERRDRIVEVLGLSDEIESYGEACIRQCRLLVLLIDSGHYKFHILHPCLCQDQGFADWIPALPDGVGETFRDYCSVTHFEYILRISIYQFESEEIEIVLSDGKRLDVLSETAVRSVDILCLAVECVMNLHIAPVGDVRNHRKDHISVRFVIRRIVTPAQVQIILVPYHPVAVEVVDHYIGEKKNECESDAQSSDFDGCVESVPA